MCWSPPGTEDLLGRRSERFPGRAKCELTAAQCETFLKAHIVDLSEKTYQDDDFEVVVQKYNGFLCAIAGSTTRANASMIRAAVKRVFKPEEKVAKDFGDAMAGALSYCYSKGVKASTGKKLSDHVKAVILRFPRTDQLEQVQRSLASPGKGSPASSASSRPAATPRRTGGEEGEVAAPQSPAAAQLPVTVPGLPSSRHIVFHVQNFTTDPTHSGPTSAIGGGSAGGRGNHCGPNFSCVSALFFGHLGREPHERREAPQDVRPGHARCQDRG